MDGRGTGKLHGRQVFVCRKDCALFVPIEAVISEKDFDVNPVNTRSTRTSEKVESVVEQIRKVELIAKSLSYGVCSSGKLPLKFISKNSFDPLGTLRIPALIMGVFIYV